MESSWRQENTNEQDGFFSEYQNSIDTTLWRSLILMEYEALPINLE